MRFTESYSVSSNKIVLNGCWLSVWDKGDLWCNTWNGAVGDGSIVLNARTYLKQ